MSGAMTFHAHALAAGVLLLACRTKPTDGAPPEANSEFRGIALAPAASATPTTGTPDPALAKNGRARTASDGGKCHMLDGTAVPSCASGDALCSCDGAESAPVGSVFSRASAMALNGDQAGARRLLEPRVMDGKGSADEVGLLKGICKTQHDDACVAAIDKLYH